MAEATWDVIVIGGGPAGSCAATWLARNGQRVLLMEKERFPRFHVGESLLPYNTYIFEELGILPELQSAGFFPKFGAQFHLGNGAKGTGFIFRNGRFTRHHAAFQVERARFDEILLRHARRSGVEVREEVSVERFRTTPDRVEVDATPAGGTPFTATAKFLVDATGRGNVTGNQESMRIPNPKLKKLAVFAHFEGVRLDSDGRAGDTVIVRLENKWFWIIPLEKNATADKVSVGLVMDRDEFAAERIAPAEVFEKWRRSSPTMGERMSEARPVTPFHVTSDFSYRNRKFFGPRLVRVGDAAGFIDPIFSSGVFLAMYSGLHAARAVRQALQSGGDGTREFAPYERRVNQAMSIYSEMVEGFYTQPFMELFLEPRAKWNLAAAVNAILAGELDNPWYLRWRMWLFFLLVRIQARHPIVPRFSFASEPPNRI